MQRYTIGLMATHPTFKSPRLVKVFMKSEPDGVRLTVESARNSGLIRGLGNKLISQEQFENRPFDPFDNMVEARWAFELFDLCA